MTSLAPLAFLCAMSVMGIDPATPHTAFVRPIVNDQQVDDWAGMNVNAFTLNGKIVIRARCGGENPPSDCMRTLAHEECHVLGGVDPQCYSVGATCFDKFIHGEL